MDRHIPLGPFANAFEETVTAALIHALDETRDPLTRVLTSAVVKTIDGPCDADLIAVGPHGILVVEIKHWLGPVEVRGQSEVLTGGVKDKDPRKQVERLAKSLYGLKNRIRCVTTSPLVIIGPDSTLLTGDVDSGPAPIRTLGQGIELMVSGQLARMLKRSPYQAIGERDIDAIVNAIRADSGRNQRRRRTVRNYEIAKELSAGEYREYLAHRMEPTTGQGEPVRLQEHRLGLHADAAERERVMRRAQRNAMALQQLEGVPGVPSLRDFFFDPDDQSILWTAYRYVSGTPLARCGNQVPILPALIAVAESLDACHQVGVIHRALSPECILIATLTGRPMLLHFDFSHIEDQQSIASGISGALGNSPYTAPEARLSPANGRQPAADIYSLGIVALELLLGRRVGDLEPSSLAAQLPQRLLRPIVAKMVAHGWSERYQRMAEVVSALRQAADLLW